MSPQDSRERTLPRVGYVLSRFPKLTETFILYEVLELQRQGVDVRVHALVREHETALHPEAERLLPTVEYPKAGGLMGSQIEWLARRPSAYLGLWAAAFLGNLRSPRFLLRALATVPIGAYFATRMSNSGVDHVHAHWATHSALAGLVAARLLGTSFSFTAHAHDIYVDRSMLREKLAAAAFVITISDYNRRYLMKLYPESLSRKVIVVHCGVDMSELTPPPRDPHPERPLQVVCVASLQPQKGHRVLIDAFAILRDSSVPAEVTIVGDGPQAPALRRQVHELGLEHVVRFRGPMTRPDVLEQLRKADVMALASIPMGSGKMEGIPVALMEGMAMGLPVVASDVSGIPELVTDGQAGHLVPPGDPAALAAAIRALEQDREAVRRMGAEARKAVANGFDLGRSVGELKRLFAVMAQSHSAQSGRYRPAEPERQRDRHDQNDQGNHGGA